MHFILYLGVIGEIKGNKGSDFPLPAVRLCLAAGCSHWCADGPWEGAGQLSVPRHPELGRPLCWGCSGQLETLKQHLGRLQDVQLLFPALESIPAPSRELTACIVPVCRAPWHRAVLPAGDRVRELQPYLAQPALVPGRNNHPSAFAQSRRAQGGCGRDSRDQQSSRVSLSHPSAPPFAALVGALTSRGHSWALCWAGVRPSLCIFMAGCSLGFF